jgi:hypothetical protein
MVQNNNINIVMLRGACLWILMALILAWSLVGIYNDIGFIKEIFPGSPKRVLQAHIDFLLMSALILGFFATGVTLPWHVRWAMVVGAFTNSSLFLLFAIFPSTDPLSKTFAPESFGNAVFDFYLYASLITTTYGFARACIIVFRSTLNNND